MEVVLFVIWIVTVSAIFGRGIDDLVGITSSVRWLKQKGEYHNRSVDDPFIIILLPVLREQRLIIETMRVFAKLKYPLRSVRIFVITTEKEIFQREHARKKLSSLAEDIVSKRLTLSFLVEKYLGLLPENALRETIVTAQQRSDEASVCQFLCEVFDAYPTTIDLVKEQVDEINEQVGLSLYTHLHYPHIHGDMNQQLEYALHQLPSHLVDQEIVKTRSYLTIYNADSRPHLDTLHVVADICDMYNKRSDMYPPALQQSAIFLENVSDLRSKLTGFLLQAAAILQTRWVLSHEIPRLRRQSRSAEQFKKNQLPLFQRLTGAEFALCVGHGFFLRYDLAEQLGLFSIHTMCDDLLWSLRLCIEHIPILPIPFLESAESPTTIKSLLIQRRSWFLGYTEFPQARQALRQEGTFNKLTLELVTLHALLRAMMWMSLSPSIFLAFILPILVRSWQAFLITLVVYAVYGFLSYWITLTELAMLRNKSGGSWSPSQLSRQYKLCLVLFSLPVFLIESIGVWWCVFQRIDWVISHKPIDKQKTER